MFFNSVDISRQTHITSLSFHCDMGNALYSSIDYSFTNKNGECFVSIVQEGTDPDRPFVTAVDPSLEQQLLSVLTGYRVGRWNGFNKFDRRILDGRSFTLNVRFPDGKTVSAHGYMRWPKNYFAVRDELKAIFTRLCPEKT